MAAIAGVTAAILFVGALVIAVGIRDRSDGERLDLEYRYTRSMGAWLRGEAGPYALLTPLGREIWIGTDSSGRIRERYDRPIFLGERDRAAWQANPYVEAPSDRCFERGGLAYEDLTRYPQDDEALRSMLTAAASQGPAQRYSALDYLDLARGILWETVPPPSLSRAVLGALRGQPGIEISSDAKDRTGRPGIAFSADDGVIRRTLILESQSGELLGEELTQLTPLAAVDARPPVVMGYMTYLESRMVTTLPAEECQPAP